jgi:hypothetical protein
VLATWWKPIRDKVVVEKRVYYSDLADQKMSDILILKGHVAQEVDLLAVYIGDGDHRLGGRLPRGRVLWPSDTYVIIIAES